ncbi:MAG: long-chain fatty acid--CoA ligase [Deltaproteobacteria bacterium]|nr:long-chain fatty acid--CoA ligase [Deltaproteobacteria bacterium]MBW1928153.1 long-chain fatty acid--CoA ligase [Deltaproteobacteria bacterium]MBW2025652.1 long-chain fatty acid--CoA ligase [Deltaproteobacteria bacterium]MBW2125628.1 long-chain fatty acid--CoA ligase [Deltaproteobacteria bacterium]RLB23801.1 MAG: long-chain fatty acid--CoA ligase [Deltaproteobacteria bacterium]
MIKSMNTAWWVERWSDLHPNKPAIIFEDQTITYGRLHARINAAGCWLQSLGIEKGDRVAAMLSNCPGFIELYLACSRLGAIFVPINFRLAAKEVEYTLRNCRPRLFVFGAEFSEALAGLDFGDYLPPMLVAVVGDGSSRPEALDYEKGVAAFEGKKRFLTSSTGPNDPEEAQVIMYTSGTTGEPKGAVLSHRKTFFNCLNADIFFKLSFDDIMLIILPLFHSGGLFIQASPCLYKGATMVIHRKFNAERTYADINRYEVTKFLGVPTIYRALLSLDDRQRADTSSLKVCAIGGEKTTHELLIRCNEAGFPVRQIMGQTETSILLWASEEDSLSRPGTVGRPVFHAEVDLVDREGRSVKPGEVGEIVVRGSIMMTEYWQDPVRTRETIRNGWLYTGDLAYMDEEGYFYLVDRAKDMYISGGENVYPAEVERVLREHPGIEDVAVVGIPDETWGEVGHAFVIRKAGHNLSAQEVITFCDGKLARYKWPKSVSFVESFPRTTLGKVKKHLLVRQAH